MISLIKARVLTSVLSDHFSDDDDDDDDDLSLSLSLSRSLESLQPPLLYGSSCRRTFD